MKKIVYIVIGCDTDPDRVGFLDNVPTDTLAWKGMTEGIPVAKEKVNSIKDVEHKPPIFTWCLRVDEQVQKVHGDYNSVIEKYKDFLLELESSGDELSWHPHFFKYDDESNKWYQELNDENWQIAMLKNAYRAYQSTLPGRAKSVRTGWVYHNNLTMKTMDELNIEVDFSAIPGMALLPKSSEIKSVNFYDWSTTPNHPYYPSKSDYRKQSENLDDNLKILEAPNFVSNSLIWSFIGGLVLAKKMKDIKPIFKSISDPAYWITITGKPNLFAPLLKSLKTAMKKRNRIFFVTYFHPDELLPNNSAYYSLDNMLANLASLKDVIKENGFEMKFIKAVDMKNILTINFMT